MKGEQQWSCPNCGYHYTSFIELDYPPTHKCKENVNRIYTMKMVDGTDE